MDNVKRRPPPPPVEHAKPMEQRFRGDFVEWLAQSGGTLAATTYNSGKLAILSAAGGEPARPLAQAPNANINARAGRRRRQRMFAA